MAIQFRCICGQTLQCSDELAGKTTQCSACGARVQVPATPQKQAQMLGDFRLVRKIGQGGMGAVYEAIQVKLDRRVALKVLPKKFTDDPVYLERFQREAKSAAALNHPNIIQVYDIAEEKGHHFFAMEFVDGESVQDLLKQEGKLPVEQALSIIEGVANGLRAAHRQGIIHRDIKPDNIMLTQGGEVKLADLGLAKKTDDDGSVTQTGAGMGTPYYMAPEQAEDARSVDHRADIYSLGITLFHLVTGEPPFTGDSSYSIILAHAMKPMPSGADLGVPLPENVEALIQKMCAKKPDERYQDYGSLLEDLEKTKSGKGGVAAAPAPNAPVKKGKKKTRKESGTSAKIREQPTVPERRRRAEEGARHKPARPRPKGKTRVLIGVSVAALLLVGISVLLATRTGSRPRQRPAKADVRSVRIDTEATKQPTTATVTTVKAKGTPASRADWLLADSEVPTEVNDQYGNPIRKGKDEETGLPLEIRHRQSELPAETRSETDDARQHPRVLQQALGVPTATKAPYGNGVVELNPHADIPAGRVLHTLSGHPGVVRGVAWSPDGKTITTGGFGCTLIMWNAETGEELRRLKGHTSTVTSVDFSPDGAVLASSAARRPGELFLWDLKSGERLRALTGTQVLSSATFSPDGSMLAAAGGYDCSALVWEVETGRRLHCLKHTGRSKNSAVLSVAWSPDNSMFASGGWFDGTAALWDVRTGKQLRTLREAQRHAAYSLAWSPDGRTIASGSQYPKVVIFDAATGEFRHTWEGHKSAVYRPAFSPDGSMLASPSHDGTVIIWSVKTGHPLLTLKGHTKAVWAVAWSPDGKRVASGSDDKTVRLWQVVP